MRLRLLLTQAATIRRVTKQRDDWRALYFEGAKVRDDAIDTARRLQGENEALRARVAVLADLADPDARRLAAAVLKTIERL